MALLLYDHRASSNALKARFLLAELELPYERVHVPFTRPRPDEMTAVHPFGTIPLLRDDELVVGESNAILRYLAGRERRDDLYPEAPGERARVDWALDTWSAQVRPLLQRAEMVGLFYADDEGQASPEGADQAALADALAAARPALDAFERFVADDGTVLGGFTIADCAVAPVLWRYERLPLSFDPWPKLSRLRDALTARPAFAAAEPFA